MFKLFMITNVVPVMASIGANINQVADGTKNEVDSIVFSVALVICSVGIVVGFFKKNLGLMMVGGTIVLFLLYFLLAPILQTVQTLAGG